MSLAEWLGQAVAMIRGASEGAESFGEMVDDNVRGMLGGSGGILIQH